MLMFNFRMQREVAEKYIFKRFWLEPVFKYKPAKCSALVKRAFSEADPCEIPWFLLITEQPRCDREIFFTSVKGGSQITK